MALIKGSSQGGATPAPKKKAPARSSVNGGHVGVGTQAEHYLKEMATAVSPIRAIRGARTVLSYDEDAADRTGVEGPARAVYADDIDAANRVGRAASAVGGYAETGVEKAMEALGHLGRQGNVAGPDDALGAGRIGKR
jgi:hypothetical protein